MQPSGAPLWRQREGPPPPRAAVVGGAGGGSLSPGGSPEDEKTPAPEESASPTAGAELTPTPAGVIPENVDASPEFLALRNTLAKEIEAYAAQVGGVDG